MLPLVVVMASAAGLLTARDLVSNQMVFSRRGGRLDSAGRASDRQRKHLKRLLVRTRAVSISADDHRATKASTDRRTEDLT
jgi:hypothetical protein